MKNQPTQPSASGAGTQTAHTPGPWRVDPSHPLCIEAPDGNVALVNLARASRRDAELIASSPTMLEALKEIEAICTESQSIFRKRMGTRVGLALTTARAAIAKAEEKS